MKLFIISYDFPPSDGGIARLCQEIAVGQAHYFDEVIVLTPQVAGQSYTYNYENVKRIEFSNRRFLCEIEMVKYLRRIKEKENYVILTATWHPEGLIGYLAGFKNLFFLGHGTEFLAGQSFFRKKVWLKFYAYFILGRAKAIICNSNYTKNLAKKINSSTNTYALPLAVNESFFIPQNSKYEEKKKKFIISTVSRIEKFKGHDFIAKVIAQLPDKIKENLVWRIGGKGPDLNYLKKIVSDYNISEIVKFEGFISDDSLPVFYRASDLFILCSRESLDSTAVEGFGLVFLEAQACGIPSIGTKTGGISDAIEHGNGGWLIEQDNEVQLREILLKFISDSDFLKKQKILARKRIEQQFTWKYYNEELFKILNT